MGGEKPESHLLGMNVGNDNIDTLGVSLRPPEAPNNVFSKSKLAPMITNVRYSKLWGDCLKDTIYDNSIRGNDIELPGVTIVKDEFLCVGVGSKQATGKHILFLDLDDHDQAKAEKVARKLINAYGVSDCYIVRSSPGNHHLVCFDMLDFLLVKGVAKQYAHGQWAKFRGDSKDFVLRISPKLRLCDFSGVKRLVPVDDTHPVLVSKVESPFSNYPKSNSLRRVFQNLWGEKIKKDRYFTDSQKFRFHVYRVRLVPKGKKVETFEAK